MHVFPLSFSSAPSPPNASRCQFKDFHEKIHEREPAKVFAVAKGFYVRYIEDIPDACVKQWNVQHIGLSKKSRHLDRVAQKQVLLAAGACGLCAGVLAARALHSPARADVGGHYGASAAQAAAVAERLRGAVWRVLCVGAQRKRGNKVRGAAAGA